MKKIFLTVCAILVAAGSANAQSWNLDGFVGKSSSDELMWDGVDFATNAGRTFGVSISKSGVFTPNLELGFELSRATAEYTGFEPNSISGTSAMVTAKYNFIDQNDFQLYGGVGLGAVKVTYFSSTNSYSNSETVAGGQITLGARYAISPAMKIFVEARYLQASDARVALSAATADAEFSSKSIVLGLRRSF